MMEHAPLAAVLVQRMLDCSAADHNMATMVSSAQSPQASEPQAERLHRI